MKRGLEREAAKLAADPLTPKQAQALAVLRRLSVDSIGCYRDRAAEGTETRLFTFDNEEVLIHADGSVQLEG